MDKDIIILLSILTQIHLCLSFITPNEVSEVEDTFVFQQIEYIMLDIRVTWIEASIICESYKNGSLAIIDTDEIAAFLGEALSETNLEMEDLWIGAKATSPGGKEFKWLKDAGTYVPDQNFILRGKEHLQPNTNRDCLSFARRFHLVPHLINLECILHRAFICERPYIKEYNGTITTPDWFVIGKYKYAIFYDRKTWRQSVRECRRKHSAHLASFRNDDEVKIVGKFELIGRPSLENAWIGGYFKYGAWKFLYDGSTIPEKMDNETMFPPWRQDRPLKHAGCLLLDRHLALHPVFLEARCERRRSYICTKPLKDMPDYVVIIINNTGYIMYYAKKNWEDARDTCIGLNASLTRVTQKNIHDITYIMGENFTEINHIWIGGRLSKDGKNFLWIDNQESIPPNNKDFNHYPPWYDNEYDQDFACLNMDRENHNRPLFYGAACETPQAFICYQPDLNLLPKPAQLTLDESIPDR